MSLNALFLATVGESPMKLDLYLKNDELSTEALSGLPAFVTGDSSLLNCHNVLKCLNNYRYTQSNCT